MFVNVKVLSQEQRGLWKLDVLMIDTFEQIRHTGNFYHLSQNMDYTKLADKLLQLLNGDMLYIYIAKSINALQVYLKCK